MTAILKSIRKIEDKFDKHAERFVFCHPYLAFGAMFIGMPLFILIAVSACTTVVALMFSLISGWL